MQIYDFYIASALFSEAETNFNYGLTRQLEMMGMKIFLPQESNKYQDIAKHGTRLCYEGNINGILASKAMIAICEGADVDSGVSWEVGFLKGMNFVMGNMRIPKRKLFLLRTDLRQSADDSTGINLMLSQGADEVFLGVSELLKFLKGEE